MKEITKKNFWDTDWDDISRAIHGATVRELAESGRLEKDPNDSRMYKILPYGKGKRKNIISTEYNFSE